MRQPFEILRFLRRGSCELWWLFEQLRHRAYADSRTFVARSRSDISPDERRAKRLLERRLALRRMLRRVPYWGLGHIRLGLTELDIAAGSDAPADPRTRAAIRLSAEAAVALSGRVERLGRLVLESKFLFARDAFLERDYERGLQLLTEILEPRHAVHLSGAVNTSALEYSGLALMALGRHSEAAEAFQRIAPRCRSKEVQAAMSYVQRPAELL